MKILATVGIVIVVVVVLTFTFKAVDEKRAKNGKKFIFSPNV